MQTLNWKLNSFCSTIFCVVLSFFYISLHFTGIWFQIPGAIVWVFMRAQIISLFYSWIMKLYVESLILSFFIYTYFIFILGFSFHITFQYADINKKIRISFNFSIYSSTTVLVARWKPRWKLAKSYHQPCKHILEWMFLFSS